MGPCALTLLRPGSSHPGPRARHTGLPLPLTFAPLAPGQTGVPLGLCYQALTLLSSEFLNMCSYSLSFLQYMLIFTFISVCKEDLLDPTSSVYTEGQERRTQSALTQAAFCFPAPALGRWLSLLAGHLQRDHEVFRCSLPNAPAPREP